MREIEANSRPLYRSYPLKEALTDTLDYRQPKRAEEALPERPAWASRSKLDPFMKAARTIRQHKHGVCPPTSATGPPTPPSRASTTGSA